ncbi:RidA family protein [Methylobacterium nodulans]|uniref:Endoribonuclease L-PSP n=1 Tax=Methylobacterium nodulans (strain LMG 21967 / CNCM I-2342 / ORS 2060) TaxID=460265 RepID=B8IA78_METNO|nr:RidA family protein [Methylobacterium nodulans]ACL59141.1 Endoribonuclease L-PSP [Methylobacterium nodulans ORS 2060]
MSIQRSGTNKRLSKLVVHRGLAYLAGQVADDLNGSLESQTRETLAKIDALLTEAGTDKTRILSAQIWLADMAEAAKMNAVWESWMPEGHAPARATVGAPLASSRHLVEIKVVAAVD